MQLQEDISCCIDNHKYVAFEISIFFYCLFPESDKRCQSGLMSQKISHANISFIGFSEIGKIKS